jgi:hypothetical protein
VPREIAEARDLGAREAAFRCAGVRIYFSKRVDVEPECRVQVVEGSGDDGQRLHEWTLRLETIDRRFDGRLVLTAEIDEREPRGLSLCA